MHRLAEVYLKLQLQNIREMSMHVKIFTAFSLGFLKTQVFCYIRGL